MGFFASLPKYAPEHPIAVGSTTIKLPAVQQLENLWMISASHFVRRKSIFDGNSFLP